MVIVQNSNNKLSGWNTEWEFCFNILKKEFSTYYNPDIKKINKGYRDWILQDETSYCFKMEVVRLASSKQKKKAGYRNGILHTILRLVKS